MDVIDVRAMKQMFFKISDVLTASEQELCKLDSFVGDGDHGITVSRGFSAVKTKINEQDCGNLLELFTLTGEVLTDTMGGAMGPIIGSIFTAMGEKAGNAETIDTVLLGAMLEEGVEAAQLIGSAKAGDRTLLDALIPAVNSLREDADKPIARALEDAAAAAKAGAENTKNMIAKKGRAKFLQEKSLGYQDAGATSMYLILSAMADYCKNN